MPMPMPAPLLSALLPVQLHVINPSREIMPMQKELLSSPHLHTLDFTVYGDFFERTTRSEFRALKTA